MRFYKQIKPIHRKKKFKSIQACLPSKISHDLVSRIESIYTERKVRDNMSNLRNLTDMVKNKQPALTKFCNVQRLRSMATMPFSLSLSVSTMTFPYHI